MSVSITIRDVPDETHAELAARAVRCNRSLQAYLSGELIELAKRRDNAALMERVRERVERSGVRLTAEEILQLRDMGRR